MANREELERAIGQAVVKGDLQRAFDLVAALERQASPDEREAIYKVRMQIMRAWHADGREDEPGVGAGA